MGIMANDIIQNRNQRRFSHMHILTLTRININISWVPEKKIIKGASYKKFGRLITLNN